MKSCNPKLGKSFLDIYAFLNKSLASHPETIHTLELELYRLDHDFSLTILSKKRMEVPHRPPCPYPGSKSHYIRSRRPLHKSYEK